MGQVRNFRLDKSVTSDGTSPKLQMGQVQNFKPAYGTSPKLQMGQVRKLEIYNGTHPKLQTGIGDRSETFTC